MAAGAVRRNDVPVATRPGSWGWVISPGPWPPALAGRPRLLAA